MEPGVVAADLAVKRRRLETVLDELEAAEVGVRVAREEAEAAFAHGEGGALGGAGDRGAGWVSGGGLCRWAASRVFGDNGCRPEGRNLLC